MTLVVENFSEEVGRILKKHHLKLATAESCTAGGLSYWITSIAGSSEWFDRGFVTYSNESKMQMLGVKEATLKKHGAVSEDVAREMAEGALKNSEANLSIAVTGIAGPNGATADKPVGTVWFALAGKKLPTHSSLETFSGDRQAIRARSIERALEALLEFVIKQKG